MNRGSGTSTTQWNRATLFVVSGKGIIYGDREMTPDEFIEDKSDAIKLKYKIIDEYMKDSANVIELDLPYKPEATQKDRAARVSMTVAKDILSTQKLGGLLRGLTKARKSSE